MNRSHAQGKESEDSYFVSMTDIMVGLLFIFILMLTFFLHQVKDDLHQSEVDVVRQPADEAAEQRNIILNALQKFLQDNNITQVSIDEEHGILRLPEGVLFGSGEVDINSDTAADRVARILSRAFYQVLGCSVFSKNKVPLVPRKNCISKNKSGIFVDAIFVEGHTDNVPVHTGGLPGYSDVDSNLKLSVFRATNTYDVLVDETPELTELFSPSDYPIFASTGYGETRPIDDNFSEHSRKRNRRIDIRILMDVPKSSTELEEFNRRLLQGYKDEIN